MFGQFCTHHLWFLYDLIILHWFVIFAWVLKFLPDLGLNVSAESPTTPMVDPLTYWLSIWEVETMGCLGHLQLSSPA